MRRLLGLCSMLAVGALCLSAAGELSGRRAPSFTLPDAGFEFHDIADYRGKVILLDIVKPGCENCEKLGPVLDEVQARFADRVVVLSVVNPPETPATVSAYVSRTGTKARFLFDCGQMVASYLRPNPVRPTIHVPHLFLIDPEGMIANDYGEAEAGELTVEQVVAEVERMLSAPDTAQAR